MDKVDPVVETVSYTRDGVRVMASRSEASVMPEVAARWTFNVTQLANQNDVAFGNEGIPEFVADNEEDRDEKANLILDALIEAKKELARVRQGVSDTFKNALGVGSEVPDQPTAEQVVF